MNLPRHIKAVVLPTVLVAATLMALTVIAVLSLWEADFLYFSRQRHNEMMRAHIESGFTLYAHHPAELMARLDPDSTMVLYDSLTSSRIKISRRPHGLYEAVTVEAGGLVGTKMFGKTPCDTVLIYPDRGSSVTLAGKTNIKSHVLIPSIGVVYGQMGADFFRGEELAQAMMHPSRDSLPTPHTEAKRLVDSLLSVDCQDVLLSESVTPDTIIIARKARIISGFRGSLQVFARDSIVVEDSVTLDFPSGLFSQTHVSIGDNSVINGYVIVTPSESIVTKSAYKQSKTACVRGLIHIGGAAQIQGIISGTAMIERAVYYSSRGYYDNMIYDATLLPNRAMAWPMWFDNERRKEAKWLGRRP